MMQKAWRNLQCFFRNEKNITGLKWAMRNAEPIFELYGIIPVIFALQKSKFKLRVSRYLPEDIKEFFLEQY